MPSFPKIVFMGTPDFAAAQLQTLADARLPIAAVVTAPDRPAGRGLRPQASAVKACALKRALPILQPPDLRSPAFLDALAAADADIFVVVAFRMLPQEVWQMPPLGTFNLHASLLPQYRGAAPIHWAVINGETQTGVSTFLIDSHMDTGNILLQKSAPIAPADDAGILHDRLMRLAGGVILETIYGLAARSIVPRPQPQNQVLKPAPKLFRHNTRLHPNLDVHSAANLVRGLSPSPAAWMAVRAGDAPPQILKVYQARAEEGGEPAQAGELRTEGGALKLHCRNGALNIRSVQMQGKKRMPAPEFLRGLRGSLQLHTE